jgi:hypothetical protein
VGWEIATTDEFDAWYLEQLRELQLDIIAAVELLEEHGPMLGRPHVDTVGDSKFANMKELRVQSSGRPIRVFFAFDPKRAAILLVGGDKTGQKRFYETMIPIADRLFSKHLAHMEKPHG